MYKHYKQRPSSEKNNLQQSVGPQYRLHQPSDAPSVLLQGL